MTPLEKLLQELEQLTDSAMKPSEREITISGLNAYHYICCIRSIIQILRRQHEALNRIENSDSEINDYITARDANAYCDKLAEGK